jgi:hypothetical protein
VPRKADPTPREKAANTDRWTETLFKLFRPEWRSGGDSFRFAVWAVVNGRGIVDILAIRKDTTVSKHDLLKSGDLFDFVLLQMKGGSARKPNGSEIARLRAVAKRYRAKKIVLFSWKRGAGCKFETLARGSEWQSSSAAAIFG